MKVVIRTANDYTRFLEITEEQYKFWEWFKREMNGGNYLDDIEITKTESLTYESID